jgi:uncharacterized membrane protein
MTDPTDDAKKNVRLMRNIEKIKKQNSLSSEIFIKLGLWLMGLGLIAGLIYAFGASFSAVAGVYPGYKLLRLVLRLLGQILALAFTLISIIILIAIISLLIF